MTGITEISTLLKEMKPILDNTEYVFTTLKCFELTDEVISLTPIATFIEKEGITIVVTKLVAEKNNLPFDSIFNNITLDVHSSLDAVGLTAAISTALAAKNISANVIAGYYHDHIFVQKHLAKLALSILESLSH